MKLEPFIDVLQRPWDWQDLDPQQLTLLVTAYVTILSLWLLISLIRIQRLKKLLKLERQKRLIPVLRLGIDPNIIGLYLINDSGAAAKDIHIDDFDLTLKYEHKKVLHLKFEPIALIEPGQETKLNFQIFDGQYLLNSLDPDAIAPHFKGAIFEMPLRFLNLQNIPFREIIARDRDDVYIKELTALDEWEKPPAPLKEDLT